MKELWHSRYRRVSVASGPGLAFMVETSSERRGFTLYVHLLLVAAWFKLPWFWRARPDRRYGFTVHDGAFWWSFDESAWEWKRSDPWWRRFSFNPVDRIFGRTRCDTVTGSTVSVVVPMPEGSYPATVTQETRTWTRARLPFWKRRRVDYSIDIPRGIPFMGKGENSWDCGDDGLYGTGGDSVEGAVANAVKCVLQSRRRYGETAETRGRVVMARATKEPA